MVGMRYFWANTRNRKPHRRILYDTGKDTMTWWIKELPTLNIPFANPLMGDRSCSWFSVGNLPDSAADGLCLGTSFSVAFDFFFLSFYLTWVHSISVLFSRTPRFSLPRKLGAEDRLGWAGLGDGMLLVSG